MLYFLLSFLQAARKTLRASRTLSSGSSPYFESALFNYSTSRSATDTIDTLKNPTGSSFALSL